MKNHRFLWLRNRTTDNRKCEKARNIKEKRTIEMFNTVSKQLVALRSSASADLSQAVLLQPCFGRAVFVCCAPAHKKEHPRAFGPGVFCCDRECQVEEESIFCSWVLAR